MTAVFFLYIYLTKNPEKNVWLLQKYLAAHVFNIDYNQMFIKHISMISEGSCDTEDWSNDTEISALPSQELILF